MERTNELSRTTAVLEGAGSALVLIVYGLVFGAMVGALMGLIFHALTGGKRDFSSIGGIEAGRYNVMVDEEVAEEAARLLERLR